MPDAQTRVDRLAADAAAHGPDVAILGYATSALHEVALGRDRYRLAWLSARRRANAAEAKLAKAVELLDYAMVLGQFGEAAPGGNGTWSEFWRRTEAFLRGEPQPPVQGRALDGEEGVRHE